jgi:hypothetical protein
LAFLRGILPYFGDAVGAIEDGSENDAQRVHTLHAKAASTE